MFRNVEVTSIYFKTFRLNLQYNLFIARFILHVSQLLFYHVLESVQLNDYICLNLVAIHTKVDPTWIDLRSIQIRFEKVFTCSIDLRLV